MFRIGDKDVRRGRLPFNVTENKKRKRGYLLNSYIELVKPAATFLVLALGVQSVFAQVLLRNDFVIQRKPVRLHNKGITFVTLGVGSRHSWNLNAYGQPARSIRIDVGALTGQKEFSYLDVVESMYRPMAVYRPSYIPIPLFLLLEPPRRIKVAPYAYFAKRRRSLAMLTAMAND